MRELSPFQPSTAAARSQQTRAFVRSRLVQLHSAPLCSCHPDGDHPIPNRPVLESRTRDTVRIRRH